MTLFSFFRYKKGHAIEHYKDTQHCYSLDMQTQQIWDYVGDNYVHRLNQSKIDSKLAGMSSHCMSLEGSCGTCGCSEDSGISGALFSSKVEAVWFSFYIFFAKYWICKSFVIKITLKFELTTRPCRQDGIPPPPPLCTKCLGVRASGSATY